MPKIPATQFMFPVRTPRPPVAEGNTRLRVGRSQLAEWLVAGATVGSALLIGAVHPWTIAAVAAAVAMAFVLLGQPAVAGLRSLPALTLVGLAGVCLLQDVPLPMGVLARLAPCTADVWTRALLPAGDSIAWAPISLDPGATAVEALRWLTYGLLFANVTAISARRGAAWGELVLVGAGLVTALTTVAHGLLGATRAFGVYMPTFSPAPWHVGPFLNPNNLSGYLNLATLAGFGLLFRHSRAIPAWAIGLALATMIGVSVTSGSRGGVGSLIVGLALFAFLIRGRIRMRQSSAGPVGAAVCVGAVALSLLAAGPQTAKELFERGADKLLIVVWTAPMIRDFPVFGIGRGAFESVFPAYRQSGGNFVFTHAENFVAQWVCEWGAIVAVVSLALLGWSFRPSRLGVRRSSLAAGIFSGMLALLLQNLVDLGLEVPGVCIGLVVGIGAVWGDRTRHRTDSIPPHGNAPWLRVAVATAAAALIAICASFGGRDVAADRADVREQFAELEASRTTAAPLRRRIIAAIRRHPADPYLPLVGALLAEKTRQESPMPWLQRSLERATINGRAHLALAELLFNRGQISQGLLEARLAVGDDPALIEPVASVVIRKARTPLEIVAAAPPGKPGVPMLEAMATRLNGDQARVARLVCAREAISRDPKGAITSRIFDAQAIVEAVQRGTTDAECGAIEACEARLEEHVRVIDEGMEGSTTGTQLRGRFLAARGHAAEANTMLATACERASDRINCLTTRAEVTAGLPTLAPLRETLHALTAAACFDPGLCARTQMLAGGLLARREEWQLALVAYDRAVLEEPSPERWLKHADAASHAGAFYKATRALEHVAPADAAEASRIRERIANERIRTDGP
jgi:hypothetical protein